MKRPRLTKSQTDQLISIALSGAWGKVFVVYSCYGWLVDKKLVRRATAAEIEDHYNGIRGELDAVAAKLRAAVAAEDWKECKGLADNADGFAAEIADRAEDEKRLAVLTDAAVEYAKARKAKRDEKTAAIEG